MKISNTARSACADALVDLIDGGAGAGTLKVFTGSAPTNTTDADSGTLLATLTFSDPAFGNASNGTATAASITSDTSIDNTGTAAHFRVKDSNAVVILQGTVTATSGGGDIEFNSTSFVAGGTAAISSLTITQPAGSS